MNNIKIYAHIDGVKIKVERIDFFNSTFAVFVKETATTEKMIPNTKIESLDYQNLTDLNSIPSLRSLCLKIDRKIWAKVESHECTQSWGREQTGLLILDFLKGMETINRQQI